MGEGDELSPHPEVLCYLVKVLLFSRNTAEQILFLLILFWVFIRILFLFCRPRH